MDVTEILSLKGSEVEVVKLAYLATNGESNAGKTVKTVFEKAIREASVEPVRDFDNKKISQFTEVKFSKESFGHKWLQKAEFMTWIETMKHLHLNTAPLDEVEKNVKDKCCMDEIDETKGAFMFNENLVMSAICDIMTVEQVKALWTLCSKKKELKTMSFEIFEQQFNFEARGMKELVFFYIIRYLELMGKFNTLYTDRLLGYLDEIRPSIGNPEKLDQVREILERYEIRVQPAGYCIVFCVTENRKGAAQEIDNIRNVFGGLLGYKVNVIENPNKKDIEDVANQCSSVSSLSMYDSLVCWVLTHGDPEKIQLAAGKEITRKDFLGLFAKQTCFAMKPKLFFMGSCQGHEAIPIEQNTDGSHMETDGHPNRVKGPALKDTDFDIVNVHTESDRLIAYATLPRYVAHRDDISGSLFVSFICEQIALLERQPDSSINVVEILQRTARKIHSIVFLTEDTKGVQGLGKQACYFESTLQKNFCFRLAKKSIKD